MFCLAALLRLRPAQASAATRLLLCSPVSPSSSMALSKHALLQTFAVGVGCLALGYFLAKRSTVRALHLAPNSAPYHGPDEMHHVEDLAEQFDDFKMVLNSFPLPPRCSPPGFRAFLLDYATLTSYLPILHLPNFFLSSINVSTRFDFAGSSG